MQQRRPRVAVKIIPTEITEGVVIQNSHGRFLGANYKWQNKPSANCAFVHPRSMLDSQEPWTAQAAWFFPAKHVPNKGTQLLGTRKDFIKK
jgi:hypothetical protein